MTLKTLTLKTVTLLALCTAQRSQTLAKIKLSKINDNGKEIKIIITDLLKTSRPGVKNPILSLPICKERPKLCIYSCIKAYIEKTTSLRTNNQKRLFLSTIKPFKEVGSQTISRWIKTTLEMSGIDTTIFSGHSTRAASTSKAFQKGIDLNIIKETANWSDKSLVFAKYYNKPILSKDDNFALRIIKNNSSKNK